MNKYKELTEEDLKDFMKDIFPKPIDNIKWRDKIKEGFMYQIGAGDFIAITGYQGAINFCEKLEENGMPDIFIQKSIKVTDSDGLKTDTKFYCLADIVWKKKEEDKRTNFMDSNI